MGTIAPVDAKDADADRRSIGGLGTGGGLREQPTEGSGGTNAVLS
jgi:hypothetical protein